MKTRKLIDSLTVRLSPGTRLAIERLSAEEEKGLGEITRELLCEGLRARGIA